MGIFDFSAMLAEKGHLTVDFVGDSITWGVPHCTPDETYVAVFTQMIAERYPEASVYRYDGVMGDEMAPMARYDGPFLVQAGTGRQRIDVIRCGIGGNTVRRALNRFGDYTGVLVNGRRADVTFFMFGINDALKSDPRKYVTPEQFGKDYRELLERFRAAESSAVIVMSATTNDQPIDEHVAETARVARAFGLPYIDHCAVWAAHFDPAAPHFGQGDWLSDTPGDACHPSPLGARVIARTIAENLD